MVTTILSLTPEHIPSLGVLVYVKVTEPLKISAGLGVSVLPEMVPVLPEDVQVPTALDPPMVALAKLTVSPSQIVTSAGTDTVAGSFTFIVTLSFKVTLQLFPAPG